MPTIKDVAAKAGVSIKTVSRVINNESGVSDETRQHVNNIVRELGYVPNLSAQRLKRGKSRLLALILPRIESPYAMTLFTHILAEARQRNYSVLVLENLPERSLPDTDYMGQVLKNHRVDGLITAPPGTDNPELFDFLKNNHIPYVIISPNFLNKHRFSLESTDRIGANEATRYLISLGHRRIAHITCMMSERFSQERRLGYIQAMQDAGLPVDNALIYEGDNSIKCGYEAACHLLRVSPPPTAIFAGNDEMAVGVMLAVLHLGARIPEDLSIIGFDDAPISEQVFPPLTTVAQSLPEIARVSVEKLLELIDQNSLKPNHVQISTRLVIRESCGVPPKISYYENDVPS